MKKKVAFIIAIAGLPATSAAAPSPSPEGLYETRQM